MAADLDLHAMAVDSAARSREEAELRKFLPIAEQAAAHANHDLYKGVARRARGVAHRLAGEWDQAADQLGAAAEEFRALETPWQIGRTLLELGEVERHRRNHDAAKGHYSEALAAFEGIGAVPDAARARNALEALA